MTTDEYLCAVAAGRVADSLMSDKLTHREGEVLSLVSRGRSNKAIAQALAISANTVKVHMKAIMAKLSAATRTEAARIALER